MPSFCWVPSNHIKSLQHAYSWTQWTLSLWLQNTLQHRDCSHQDHKQPSHCCRLWLHDHHHPHHPLRSFWPVLSCGSSKGVLSFLQDSMESYENLLFHIILLFCHYFCFLFTQTGFKHLFRPSVPEHKFLKIQMKWSEMMFCCVQFIQIQRTRSGRTRVYRVQPSLDPWVVSSYCPTYLGSRYIQMTAFSLNIAVLSVVHSHQPRPVCAQQRQIT